MTALHDAWDELQRRHAAGLVRPAIRLTPRERIEHDLEP